VVEAGFGIEMNGDRTARLRGELDVGAYDAATTAAAPLFHADGDVTLDLSELSFIDSSGIRLFIRLHKALDGRGQLILTGPTSHVAYILDIAGLPEIGVRVENAQT
jgi:anti-sigma B factor antagonist